MSRLHTNQARFENAPAATASGTIASFPCLPARCRSTFGGMNQPDWSARYGMRPVRRALRVRHGFTSNQTAVSAAQFNSNVSITPPYRARQKTHALLRRYDGYTAKLMWHMRNLDAVITKLEGLVQGRHTSVPYANEIEGDLAELFSGRGDEVIDDFIYDLAFYRPEGGHGLYDYERFRPMAEAALKRLRKLNGGE
jgi:hypothetical protein